MHDHTEHLFGPADRAEPRWLSPSFLTLLVCALPAVGCSAGAQEAPASPAQAAKPRSPDRFNVEVNERGVQVQIPDRQTAPIEVRLELPSGQQLSAVADDQGIARFEPALDWVFSNADVGTATVVAVGSRADVHLGALVDAMKNGNREQWEQYDRERTERRAQADRAVSFTSKVYRDKSDSELVTICKPTGPEQCFDGIDNDCDGRYDDAGCGYSSGVLQWTLTWQGDADLDLIVTGPDDEEVHAQHRSGSKSKLLVDRDCRGGRGEHGTCLASNVENAYVPAEEVPVGGTYQARAEVQWVGASEKPIIGRLSGRIGGQTWYTDLKLAPFPSVSYQVAFPIGADADGDGVAEEHDACPSEKGCWFADLKHRGCADRDADGVPDAIDACPGKTGLTRGDPQVDGCPLEFGAAWVTNQGIQIQNRIEFETGRAGLLAPAKRITQDVAKAVRQRPDAVTRLAIDGHTDEVGEEGDNIALSNQRARAVLEELVRQGVPRQLLTTRGYGETKPLAENVTAQGRKANRRVEFVILRPAPRTSECW